MCCRDPVATLPLSKRRKIEQDEEVAAVPPGISKTRLVNKKLNAQTQDTFTDVLRKLANQGGASGGNGQCVCVLIEISSFGIDRLWVD